jgi:hypothetical protein
MFDPQASDEPPPPAYELSQETFDQKTQQGIQASLQAQDSLQDMWEEWDEAKFYANSLALQTPSASSSSSAPTLPPVTAQQYPKEKVPRLPSPPPPKQEEPAVRPLRIVKKSQTTAYQKAVEARSYQSHNPLGGPTSNGGASLSRNFSVLSIGRRTPPPMFESVGPNYNGPDYSEVATDYVQVPGNSRPLSSPESVLSANTYRQTALPPQSQTANLRPNQNMAMPPPSQPPTRYQPSPRPAQNHRLQFQQAGRYGGFDPLTAYKSKPAFGPGLESTPEKIDPSSFYNSAVSAHLSTVPQRSAITPTHRTNGVYHQQELQHPRPHHAIQFDNFGGANVGRERAMSVISTDSSYYPNPPVNLSPNRGWAAFNPHR